MISLGGLPFHEVKGRKSGSGKRKSGGRDWEERNWGICGWRVIYERRINKLIIMMVKMITIIIYVTALI